jgi:hypothetical protein
VEFESLSLLRAAITETHDKKFFVELPARATAADRTQGFDIAIRTLHH